jgi:AcrR family transcriptional regulator
MRGSNGRKHTTKYRIFSTALQLFHDNGYSNVSLRDIAECVGIKAPSIYNHFSAKEDILKSMYDLFDEYWKDSCPELKDLLLLAETEPPLDVVARLNISFSPDIEPMMLRIIKIAVVEMHTNYLSEQFMSRFLLDTQSGLLLPLLDHMVKIGRIEPLDTKTLSRLWTSFSFSSVVLNKTTLRFSPEEWQKCWNLLASYIKPTN